MKTEPPSPAVAILSLALAASFATTAASGFWLRGFRNAVEPTLPFVAYEPLSISTTPASVPLWAAPEGALDLFTLRPAAPLVQPEPVAPDVAAKPGLVRVERELFPIQLAGYVRGAEGLAGVFESVATGRHVLARSGEALPGLGVRILEVRLDEGASGVRAIARVLPDDAAPIELTSAERLRQGFSAVLQLGVLQRRFRVGESFAHDGARYRVQSIQPDPPAVVIVGGRPGEPETTQTLLQSEAFSP